MLDARNMARAILRSCTCALRIGHWHVFMIVELSAWEWVEGWCQFVCLSVRGSDRKRETCTSATWTCQLVKALQNQAPETLAPQAQQHHLEENVLANERAACPNAHYNTPCDYYLQL